MISVLFEVRGDRYWATCASGYLPRRYWLEDAFAGWIRPNGVNERRIAQQLTADELFEDAFGWYYEHNRLDETTRRKFGYLRIEEFVLAKPPGKLLPATQTRPGSAENDESTEYREVITIYPASWKKGLQASEWLLQSLCRFSLYEGTSSDMEEKEVRRILTRALERPSSLPCEAVVEGLVEAGYEARWLIV